MIEIKKLTVNKNTASRIHDLNLKIAYGEFVSLACTNVRDISTLTALLCGKQRANKGKIFLSDKNITNLSARKRRADIGHVSGDARANFNPRKTLLYNLARAETDAFFMPYVKKLSQDKIDFYKEKLSFAGIGLENKLDIKVKKLTSLEVMAAALIKETLSEKKLLVLENPCVTLNEDDRFRFLELADKLIGESRLTVIMPTNNIKDAVEYGNRLVTMHNGVIVSDIGEKEKAKLTLDKYCAFWCKQFM